MIADKEVKKRFKQKASRSPDKFYAVNVLKNEGFERKKCKCGTFFWSMGNKTCGDPACSGGYQFFDKPPAKKQLDYVGVWKEFSKLFRSLGYTPIPRYPVVARWRNDTDFVQASIYNFQPHVVSGEVKPPANPLVVPQFSLRFNDIDNVGITGAHYTGFIMVGQHAFMPPEKFDQEKYFQDIHTWLNKGLGLPNKEITFHEDAWAGGGNFGPCMEFFSRGLELGNQVYMSYENTAKGFKELNLKVLDMGMGHERNAWFTKGSSTSYETTFPTVCKKLYKLTGVKVDDKLLKKFLPYSSYLNVDEVDDINKTWKKVAKKVDLDVGDLREKILPLAGLYSVGEHSRSLLVALNDGALPSNVGGGYNLRVILRRALGFIDKYNWNVELGEVAEWHAAYLKKLFPELSENLDNVQKILEVEKAKYEATKQKTKAIVAKLSKEKISEKKLLELYDSQGISPEMVAEVAKVKIPDNFYAMVASRHEKKEQEHATLKEEKLNLKGINETKANYFGDYKKIKFKAKVVKVINEKVVLDKTYFYPTSGGQLHDIGKISLLCKEIGTSRPPRTASGSEINIVNVFKQGNVIVHVLDKKCKLKIGEEVRCEIDINRRKQLAQHHTAAHIINAAARRVLGSHVNQSGAKKTLEKAHLDITHYQRISDDELLGIEKEANKIVKEKLEVRSKFMPRDEAEKRFGVDIYQGGAVPGKELRIVEIPEVEVECCGGTHLHNTKEVEKIKVLGSTKVQDGICRITFTAGSAAFTQENAEEGVLNEVASLLNCKVEQVPGRAAELFKLWKKVVKKKKKVESKKLVSVEKFDGDLLERTAEVLKTQKEHVVKTIKRFKRELNLQ